MHLSTSIIPSPCLHHLAIVGPPCTYRVPSFRPRSTRAVSRLFHGTWSRISWCRRRTAQAHHVCVCARVTTRNVPRACMPACHAMCHQPYHTRPRPRARAPSSPVQLPCLQPDFGARIMQGSPRATRENASAQTAAGNSQRAIGSGENGGAEGQAKSSRVARCVAQPQA